MRQSASSNMVVEEMKGIVGRDGILGETPEGAAEGGGSEREARGEAETSFGAKGTAPAAGMGETVVS